MAKKKAKIKQYIVDLTSDYDYRTALVLTVEVEGQEYVLSYMSDGGEPEDQSFGRDLSEVLHIPSLVYLVHQKYDVEGFEEDKKEGWEEYEKLQSLPGIKLTDK